MKEERNQYKKFNFKYFLGYLMLFTLLILVGVNGCKQHQTQPTKPVTADSSAVVEKSVFRPLNQPVMPDTPQTHRYFLVSFYWANAAEHYAYGTLCLETLGGFPSEKNIITYIMRHGFVPDTSGGHPIVPFNVMEFNTKSDYLDYQK